MRKVNAASLCRPTDGRKHHDAALRMLHHLRTPACFNSGVKPLATQQAPHLEHTHQARKMLSAAAIGVMVVIAPTEPQAILPRFLQPPRAVTTLPIGSLRPEEQITGSSLSQVRYRRGDQLERMLDAVFVPLKPSFAAAKRLRVVQDRSRFRRRDIVWSKSQLAMPLDNPKFSIRLPRNACHPQGRVWRAFHPCVANSTDVEEVGDRFDLHPQTPAAAPIKPDGRENTGGMFGHRHAILVADCESRLHKRVEEELLARRRHEINPVNKSRARFMQHSLTKPPRGRCLNAKRSHKLLHQRLRPRLPLPFKALLCRRVLSHFAYLPFQRC